MAFKIQKFVWIEVSPSTWTQIYKIIILTTSFFYAKFFLLRFMAHLVSRDIFSHLVISTYNVYSVTVKTYLWILINSHTLHSQSILCFVYKLYAPFNTFTMHAPVHVHLITENITLSSCNQDCKNKQYFSRFPV